MLEILRAWLNGRREYWGGVKLYSLLGSDAKFLALLQKGETDAGARRMQEELLIICKNLKQQQNGTTILLPAAATTERQKPAQQPQETNRNQQPVATEENSVAEVEAPANEAIYLAAKKEADDAYKVVMNKRAVLFSLAPADDLTNQNTPDRIEARKNLSIEVVTGYQHVSELYDRADHVRVHGKLPGQTNDDEKELDVDALADHLVKQTLDNTRKNYNKIKGREQTAERVALLQKHDANIQKLQERWNKLKSAV